MTRLVVGGAFAIRRIEQDVADRPEHDLLERLREVLGAHRVRAFARRAQRRLVHEVAQVGAGQPGRLGGDARQRDIRRQRHVPRVDLEDRGAADAVGELHHDAPVETARPEQRRVEHVGAIGRG